MKEDYRIDKARWEKTPPDQRIGALIKDAWLDVGISQLDGSMFPSALTDGQRAVVSLWFHQRSLERRYLAVLPQLERQLCESTPGRILR